MSPLDISELVKNSVTSVGVVLGGAWAFWKWGWSEWQEAKKNRASLDGALSAQAERLAGGLCVVSVLAHWNNRGNFPVALDPAKSRVLVFRLPETLPLGPLDPDVGLGKPLFVQKPFERLDGFELEPKTESALRSHFVLEPNGSYLFRWELFKATVRNDRQQFFWSKELVWGVPSNMALNTDARHLPRAG